MQQNALRWNDPGCFGESSHGKLRQIRRPALLFAHLYWKRRAGPGPGPGPELRLTDTWTGVVSLLILLFRMNSRQRATLESIFRHPTPSNIRWKQIVSLLEAVGSQLDEARSGSRVAVTLKNRVSVIHRPHPASVIGQHTVRDIRDLLRDAGITPLS